MAAVTTLGSVNVVDLDLARLRYHESGEGPPVVFVHGLFANAYLWRKVVLGIAAAGYRCLAPDWPLGSHTVPVPEADLTPAGVAQPGRVVSAGAGPRRRDSRRQRHRRRDHRRS
jgi:hypothetical protein